MTAGATAIGEHDNNDDNNDARCAELGWVHVPVLADTNDAWGTEAIDFFSKVATHPLCDCETFMDGLVLFRCLIVRVCMFLLWTKAII